MPLNPDGTYTAGMPSTYDLIGGAPPQAQTSTKGMDTLRALSRPQRQAKPQQPALPVQPFVEYVQSRARQDKIPSLANADDDTFLNYAKDYAEKVAPGALASRGVKINPYVVNTLYEHYRNKTHAELPQLRDYFRKQEEQLNQGPPKELAGSPPGITAADWRNRLVGRAVKGVGETLSGVARSGASPAPIGNDMVENYVKNLGPIDRLQYLAGKGLYGLFGKEKAFEDQTKLAAGLSAIGSGIANRSAEAIKENVTEPGKALAQRVSPEFEQATGRPLTGEGGLTAANLSELIAGGTAEFAPQLGAAIATRGASLIPGGAVQQGEAARNVELERIQAMPENELLSLPLAKELLSQGIPKEQLRNAIAQKSSEAAATTGGIVGAVMGAVPGLGFMRGAAGNILQRGIRNAATQLPTNALLGSLGQAASTATTNMVTGEGRDITEGTLEAGLQGAAQTLPFLAGRAHPRGVDVLRKDSRNSASVAPAEAQNLTRAQEPTATPPETQAPPQQAVPRESVQDTTAPVNNSAITDPQVAEAVRLGLEESPIPPKERLLTDPSSAQRSLANYLNEAESLLVDRYDYTPEQFAQTKPALEAEWMRLAELKPEDLVPKTASEKAVEEPTVKQAPPEEVSPDDLPDFSTTPPVREQLTKIVDEATQSDTAPRAVAEEAVTPKAVVEESLSTAQETKPVNPLKKKSEETAQEVNEATYNAGRDVSVEPTGKTVADARGALTKAIGEKTVSALENAGVLKIVQGLKDIPEAYQKEGISGVYTPEGQAYLIADHITPGAEWRTLVHEVGVHYGMRAMLPEKLYGQIENYITDQLQKNTPEAREIASAWQSAKKAGTNPAVQVNETIAHMVQSKLAQSPASIWKRAATAIRSFLFDKIGKYLPSSLARKIINNDVITNLAKSATGRAAELRTKEPQATGFNEPAYNAVPENINETTAERVAELTDLKEKPRVSKDDLNELTTTQRYSQSYFNDLNAFRFLNEKLYRQGVKVTPETDMFRAATVRQNKVSTATTLANEEYVQPALNWIATTSNRLGMDATRFANELKNFYTGKRALEINERFDLENTKLTEKAQVEREALLDKYSKGELGPGEYIEKLRDIVDRSGARIPGQEPINAAGLSDREARRMVNLARKEGITDEVIAEFEPQRKAMIEFINQNNLKSKKFSDQDEARRLALGSKWYVPFKGFADAKPGVGNEGSRLGAFTGEYSLAEGRGEGNVAQNPILSLMQDVIRSAENVADNEFLKVAFNNAMDYGAKTGVKIRRYDVEQAVQDKIKGEKLRKAYKDENTIIYDAGKSRYSITYPKGDPTLAAIKNMRKPMELPEWANTLGRLTNSYGRLFVKFNPKFLLYKAVINDITETSGKMFVDFGPKGAATYLGKYIKNLGPFGALSTYFKSPLKPRNLLERQQYALQENAPKFAKRIEQLVKYGGDTSMNQMYSATRNIYKLHDELKRISKRGVIPNTARALKAGSDILDALGDVSNGSSRVAALEAYESLMTKRDSKRLGRDLTPQEKEKIISDGALYSRKLLDFQQKSNTGVILNLVKPFTRVAITNSDRLLSAIRNPDGSYNGKKAALMTTIGTAMGVLYYTLQREADPEKIKKQTNETIAENLLIPDPLGGEPFKIPTSYGFGPLLMAPGMMLARIAYGDTDKREGVSLLRDILMTNLTPFTPPNATYHQGAQEHLFDLMQGAAPWFIGPVFSSWRNKNTFGDAITPTFENKNKFKSDSGLASTPDQWKWAANTLRELTGMDVYPESLRYISAEYGGAPMNEVIRMMSIKDKSNKGQDIEAKNLPFLPSVRSRDAEYYPSRRLGEIRTDLEDYKKQVDYDNKQSKYPVDISKLDNSKLNLLKQINSMQRKNSDERNAVLNSKLPNKVKAEKLDSLRAKFNKDANSVIERANRLR